MNRFYFSFDSWLFCFSPIQTPRIGSNFFASHSTIPRFKPQTFNESTKALQGVTALPFHLPGKHSAIALTYRASGWNDFLQNTTCMKLLKFCLCGMLVLAASLGYAQSLSPQVLSNAGGSIATPEMRLSWTLGEVAISKWQAAGNAGFLTEGYHQPRLQVNPANQDELYPVQILPNPVQGTLNLIALSDGQEVFLASLQDAQGKILVKDVILKGKAEINMSSFPAGIYFLSIQQSGKSPIQNHKVVKL